MTLKADAFDPGYLGAGMTLSTKASGTTPTVVQSAGAKVTSGNTLTITLGSNTTSGNTLLLFLVGNNGLSSTPSGWTNVLYVNPSSFQTYSAYVMPTPSTPQAAFSFTTSSANLSGVLMEFSGSNLVFTPDYGVPNTSSATYTAAAYFMPNAISVNAIGLDGSNTYSSSTNSTLLFNGATGSVHAAYIFTANAEGPFSVTFGTSGSFPYWARMVVSPLTLTTAYPNVEASVYTTGTTAATIAQRVFGGPTYFEFQTDSAWTGGTLRCGIARYNAGLTAALGADAAGCGYDSGGTVKINNTTITTIASWSAGDNIGVAINPTLALIWFRKNGGNWNNDVIGNQNPVGAVGGISLATMTAGNYKPACSVLSMGCIELRSDSGLWTYSAPSGFTAPSSYTLVTGESAGGPVKEATPPSFSTRRDEVPSNLGGVMYQPGSKATPGAAGTAVSGTTKEIGANVSKTVCLYDAVTKQLIGQTVSDGSGVFSLPALARTNVFAVAFDPTTYQALVYDQLTPV